MKLLIGGIAVVLNLCGFMGLDVARARILPKADRASSALSIDSGVVRIETTSQMPDYRVPWNAGEISGGGGTGFIIGGNRILTNAHVVSDARFIYLSKQRDPRPFPARVLFIAHDCDLALLVPEDPTFFENTASLKLGDMPVVGSTVTVYGYPIGGEKLSVTQGVVSRIDFQTYAHSRVDSHLTVQIDAAINPGNSGGPVVHNGSVVGVAFQGYGRNVAQNVGYMIPLPVIAHFLKDIQSGEYRGYMDLAVTYLPLYTPAMKRALGLAVEDNNPQRSPGGGVVISTVYQGGSADGILQPYDVILSIDGYRVSSNGSIELEKNSLEMAEIIERKFQGDRVVLEILRNRKPLKVVVPLRERWPFQLQANSYGKKPRYFIYGGLLFQPADQNFMESHNPDNLRLNYYFDQFLNDGLYKEHPEIVVLSNILPDSINVYLSKFRYSIVDRINGMKIRSLNDLPAAFSLSTDFDVIETIGTAQPIVLNRKEVQAARARILERYKVSQEFNL